MSELYECEECNGTGESENYTWNDKCIKCGGTGTVDWAARATGSNAPSVLSMDGTHIISMDACSMYPTTMNTTMIMHDPWKDAIDKASKDMADEIDRKVLEAIVDLAEKNNLKI